MSHFYR